MSLSTLKESEHQETWAPEYSNDTMFRGRVLLRQHRQGYRFSVDAVLLSSFAATLSPAETLDLGTGCGVIPLLLAELWEHSGSRPTLTAIERQPTLAALAQQNIESNQRSQQIRLVCDDMRTWSQRESSRWKRITCNPPYQAPQQGRISPNPERAAARHELYGTLEEIVQAGATVLHPEGSMLFVYPSALYSRLLRACSLCALQPLRLRWVHPRLNAPAKLILLEASQISQSLMIEPPLVLYRTESPREYTEEAEAIFAGGH